MVSETNPADDGTTGDGANPPASLPAEGLPRHTTPTWEVELLISGVAVFAMLQLAGWLNGLLYALLARFGAGMLGPLKIMYVYTESASVILAVTFVLHLMLRAHWIALVGMYSVYPDGVRWDRMRIGPVQKALAHERMRDPAELIEQADNRATTVFAVGVQLATTLLRISLLLSVLFLLAMGAGRLLGMQQDPASVFNACVIGVMAPYFLALLLDRRAGHLLQPGGTARRVLSRAFSLYSLAGLSRSSPVISLLASHGGRRRTGFGIMLLMTTVLFGVVLGLYMQRSPVAFGAYALFPRPDQLDGRAIDAAHYDDRRDPAHDAIEPFVQSAQVGDAYVQLTIPYAPGSDDRAIQAACPGVVRMPEGSARAQALLDCLQSLHPLQLDGSALKELQYDIGSDPRTGRPALLAMVDVRKLEPGRHEIAIATPRPGDDPKNARTWVRIPFWH